MDDAEGLAAWAALLADRSRAAMCLALLDNRAWTVGELARHAGVSMSTASEHADRLVKGGLAAEHRQGRHRYLSLPGPEVAALLETVSSQAALGHAPVRSMATAHRMRNLTAARTCYDHLAGVLGVAVADAFAATGVINRESGLTLTGDGRDRLKRAGIELGGPVARTRRPLLRDCLDWTERRPHLGGVLGAAVCRQAFDAGWIVRIGTGRAVRVTPAGADAFADQLGVLIPAAPDAPGAARAEPAGVRRR
jgi:DNA-binding transcriptional ArsR family regulator